MTLTAVKDTLCQKSLLKCVISDKNSVTFYCIFYPFGCTVSKE